MIADDLANSLSGLVLILIHLEIDPSGLIKIVSLLIAKGISFVEFNYSDGLTLNYGGDNRPAEAKAHEPFR